MIEGFDLGSWLAPLRMAEFPPAADEVLSVGDLELAWSIAEGVGGFELRFASRGTRRPSLGSASDLPTALRFLVLEIGSGERSARRLPELPRLSTPGVTIDVSPEAAHLKWPGGWADVVGGSLLGRSALLACAIEHPLPVVAASILAPDGAPAFRVA